MKITVAADDGSTAFEYDTAKNSMCLCPGVAERPAVVAALAESIRFLGFRPKSGVAGDGLVSNIAAHTNAGATYPSFVNFTREADGTGSVHLRGDPKILEDRFYICGFERDKGQPGRCTPGDDRCNNYCNMAPGKGPMQPHAATCTQVICGETVKLTLTAVDFEKLIAELKSNPA